jgi:hypothetical protein
MIGSIARAMVALCVTVSNIGSTRRQHRPA